MHTRNLATDQPLLGTHPFFFPPGVVMYNKLLKVPVSIIFIHIHVPSAPTGQDQPSLPLAK